MKVGTDGVLLGAWAPVEGRKRILDVGTGTGLIALQMAQRTDDARIVGIEIDEEAAAQARENVVRSPWASRIEVVCANFREYRPEEKFDLIVSNPPYFVDALKCPDKERSQARHSTGGLNYDLLIRRSAALLQEGGLICVIIPTEAEKMVADAAWGHGMYPCRQLNVYTKPGKPRRRVLLALGREDKGCLADDLYIESSAAQYSPEYIALTSGFYLNM